MANRPRAVASLKVLFIGNSFTARNDLPELIAGLAEARGKTFHHDIIVAGGASLRTHWNAGEAQKAIKDGRFDFVVLQEQSTLPVKNAKRMHENVRLFDEMIRAAGSKTVLYMTWARQHALESQLAITAAYNEVGRELGAVVVPVGTAWEKVLGKKSHPVLHDKDASHPSPTGSYLAACVFFAVLFQENPEGIEADVPGLETKAKALLQKAAWKASQSFHKGGSK